MDHDEEKLRIFGGMAKQVAKRIRPELKFRLTTDAVDAVKGADYLIASIRVGGDEMRIRDERTALGRGILGQQTNGAAGFFFVLDATVIYLLGGLENQAESCITVRTSVATPAAQQ